MRAGKGRIFMAKKEFTISNKLGIHARPAAQFVKTANRFKADVFVEKDGEEVDGKSIMGLMMLAAGHGSVIIVSTDGPDEAEAMDAIGDLISRKFEEEGADGSTGLERASATTTAGRLAGPMAAGKPNCERQRGDGDDENGGGSLPIHGF